MTQKEKDLLIKDLCARLPYGVKVYNTTFKNPTIQTLYGKISSDEFLMEETYTSVGVDGDDFGSLNKRHYTGYVDFIKPYLRPMSSMTDEEYKEYSKLWNLQDEFPTDADIRFKIDVFDWLDANYFDFRGLIPMGLAIAVTQKNNPYKK